MKRVMMKSYLKTVLSEAKEKTMNLQPKKIKKVISVMLSVMSFQLFAAADLGGLRPDNISDEKWAALQEVIIEAKLLPTPEGVGGEGSNYGESVAVDGDRALIGSPLSLEHGVVYVLEMKYKSSFQMA